MAKISNSSDNIPIIIHNVKDHSLRLSHQASPSPSGSQYLIKVHATTFTAGELQWPEPNSLKDPIPGFDLAGTVLAIPKDPPTRDTQYYPIRTAVYGLTSFSRHGNARQLAVAEHSEIATIPQALSFDIAASIPLSALTAWQALFDHANLRPEKGANADKRILITAASGGVGIWLVQLANWAGAHITGTCGTGNVEFVKCLGAADVLDYKTTDIVEWMGSDAGKLFDIVVDYVRGSTLSQVWTLAKPGGVVTSIALPPDIMKPNGGVRGNVRSFWFIVEPSSNQLQILGDLVSRKIIAPKVDSIWEFEHFQQAIQRVYDGHVSGKVVLTV
jgi:NADPH:quinone reductase-like Zn-dependent oxidoreductase